MSGYIFNFKNHGAFSPDGKVADAMPQTEIDAHSAQLSAAVVEHMKTSGCAVLHLGKTPLRPDHWQVSTWDGAFSVPVSFSHVSRNNWNAKRTDVWFDFDGSRWHGVNVGDNDIVRCRRTKGAR